MRVMLGTMMGSGLLGTCISSWITVRYS